MITVLVTGSKGFIGKNLCAVLRRRDDIRLHETDADTPPGDLESALAAADVIFHLAGVNRPRNVEEFRTGNTGSTEQICRIVKSLGRSPKIVLSSSIQAELDNPYGESKRLAEEVLRRFTEETGGECVVYRFKNLFGKWCRPNYNSVTATFCHNIAHDLPITISDPTRAIDLTYIDDVVAAFVSELAPGRPGYSFGPELDSTRITLGELAEKIRSYRAMRATLHLPDFSSYFERALYATYLSYLDPTDFGYGLQIREDARGSLAEFIKSASFGQIFISQTRPGVTRGHHYHHTKTEKFLVVHGTAKIKFRRIVTSEKTVTSDERTVTSKEETVISDKLKGKDKETVTSKEKEVTSDERKDEGNGEETKATEIIEYVVKGEEYRVLDIPPGYTHSITNVGDDDLVTLFWASEVFDPSRPDTYNEEV